MGWKEGEQVGIGSANPGLMKPIEIVMKNDRRGLQTSEESLRMINIEKRIYKGQHPVSYLIIFCLKRRWLMPEFELVDEGGPPHMKFFIYKVRVNGVDYQPATSSCNKKSAKVEAAICCLQKIDHLG
ncbi:hypothetical protein HELRODRAFT_105281 [Helobdella robusta]|uniref:G-patch domain-containing protein n=1 Tax=Helobdella robusta TaxID=6412 RepID=T1EDS9_HELRO|nr:hypothetical protein HELRODRAFT_105281 [Helobdella robusta]ESO12329.1 hypothetical protein HELRODRAFT_105281 [Helobdella robusta]